MKVKINHIEEEKQENAVLNLHKSNQHSDEIVSYLEKENFRTENIACTLEGKLHYVSFFEIIFVESSVNTRILHTQKNSYKCNKRLYELEKILPTYFLRISKSSILNLRCVSVYKPAASGLMKAELINGQNVYISRNYVKKLKEVLTGGK